jgi:hypothetical protein
MLQHQSISVIPSEVEGRDLLLSWPIGNSTIQTTNHESFELDE